MGEIKHNNYSAKTVATQIFSVLDDLNASVVVERDENSTISGNVKAQEAINSVENAVSDTSLAIENLTNNLQSVANEFEAMDRKLRDAFSPDWKGRMSK
ncbi:TIGR04197 family type VII secretion effector [uncultured Enterococcus sp.]|uniref:TIGR04197 family type VII secretion effector n=1 Tax=uncultured Enterococcus sp. TaxID=167972 RepID=UPI002AA7DDCC|nr:TIGR04197 family type VII secretion effector [uncultured Enterococcus sp.]